MPHREERDLLITDVSIRRFGTVERHYGIEIRIMEVGTRNIFAIQMTTKQLGDWLNKVITLGDIEVLPPELSKYE